MTLAACNGTNNNRAGTDRSGTAAAHDASRQGATSAAITVTGCLQKGSGADFILTRINEPAQSVGTTGGTQSASAPASDTSGVVQREQLRSAANAYRVDAERGVDLNDLVGKEVRVVGTIGDNADLPKATDLPSTNGDSKPAAIEDGDLARIAATSVSQTAAMCSGAQSGAPASGGSSQRR